MSIVETMCALRKGQTEKKKHFKVSSRELKSLPMRGKTSSQDLPEREGDRHVQTIPLWPIDASGEAQDPVDLNVPVLAVPFHLPVPDYIQADWLIARPRFRPTDHMGRLKRGRQRIGGGLHWAIHQAVLIQKSSPVILADVVLAQILWGGEKSRWPRNWRHRLVQRLKRAAALNSGLAEVIHRERDSDEYACPTRCSLHGTCVRHQHLEIAICTRMEQVEEDDPEYLGTFLGALEVFGEDDYEGREYHWSPQGWSKPEGDEDAEQKAERDANEKLLKQVKQLKREGRLTAIYFPMKLFGSSPRLGLSWQQRQLHQAITRELTRNQGKRRSDRQDRAEILIGGQSVKEGVSFSVVPCPYLETGCHYVAFNGNGSRRKRHLHGRGYRPLVWMRKAAYEIPDDEKSLWRQMRAFLRDLARLAELFDLVIAAWHPKKHAWLPLADLLPLTRTKAGRAWLRGCLLRVYTGEDFLDRWRRLIAARMGFSIIPDTVKEQTVELQQPTPSREAFLSYLRKKGISTTELARQLGLSRFPVSRHLSGQRGWTASWKKRIERWVANQADASREKVATNSL